MTILRATVRAINSYVHGIAERPVSHSADPDTIRAALAQFDFAAPIAPESAIEFATECLTNWGTHALHPSHFGLFVPGTTPIGVAAEAIVAAFNPAVGAWDLSPAAVEIERHVVRAFASRFGFRDGGGTITTGGAEANHTALLCALVRRFPLFARDGLTALGRRPVVYASTQSHHSIVKAALACGLGTDGVRMIPVDRHHAMDVEALAAAIERDRDENHVAVMVCATAGTTSSGAIDPLHEVGRIGTAAGAWFHVDAAWGGAAILLPELAPRFAGIGTADSVTFDPHKWLSVPMGAGLLLTKEADVLRRTFATPSTSYMPPGPPNTADPYAETLQWSRRFAGLKIFLALATTSWSGYEQEIRRQTRLGERLRDLLIEAAWDVVNHTPLPIVCFRDATRRVSARDVVSAVNRSGRAWLSVTTLPEGEVIRACITSHLTTEDHVGMLVELLRESR